MRGRSMSKPARINFAILAAILSLFFCAPSRAQCTYTTVSGTITDPNGLAYSNGMISATLQPSATQPLCGGVAISGFSQASLDVTGSFTMNLASNTAITPSGTTWVFTVNGNSGLPPPVGKGGQTFTTSGITITGSTQSLSVTLSALATALTNISSGGAGNPAAPACALQLANSTVTGFLTASFGGVPLEVNSCASPTVLIDPMGLSVAGNQNNSANVVIAGPNPRIDAQAFGSRPLATNPQTTCSTGGSGPPYTTLNCVSAAGLVIKDGLAVYLGGPATTQTTPAAPTVTSPVIQGSSTYSYECVGIDVLDGLTAASASGSVINAPAVFGNPPVSISGVSWTGGVVTITTSTTFDANFASYTANTKHANIVGMGTGLTSLDSYAVLIASEPSATSFTFALAGSGSGTFTGATARAINTFAGTAASRSGLTLTVTTDISSNIQVGPYTNPVIVILTGWFPADINGQYKLSSNDGDSVSGTTISIHRNALSETESATQNGFVTVYEKNVVSCPNIVSPTVKYAVYGTSNPSGTMQFLGVTKYKQRGFVDWGYWIRNGSSGVYTPGWLPSTPPTVAQTQMGKTQITGISGNTLTINPGLPTAVTSAITVHDDLYGIVNAANSIPHNQNYAIDVVLSPPLSTSCSSSSPCPYHIESPAGFIAGLNLVQENEVIGDETFYGGFNGFKIKKGENAVAQYDGEAFGQTHYEPWLGHANPFIAFTSGQSVIDGIYFGTTEGGTQNDDGQELVHFDGTTESEYGSIINSYFSTGVATTSVGIVCVSQCDYLQIISPVFNGSIPWHSNTSGTINWGPAIGSIETKGDDNSTGSGQCPGEIYLVGQPQFVGKGWLMNGVNCNTGAYQGFSVGSPAGGVDDQQPVTPLVMAEGGVGGPNNLSIYHSTMDSVSIPLVGNWGRPLFWTLDSDGVSSGSSLVSGSFIANLTVKDPSYPSGSLGQNINLSLVTPINPDGDTGGVATSAVQTAVLGQQAPSQFAGTVTLSAGSGTVTFGTAYNSAPVCVGVDQTNADAVKMVPSTTGIAVTGNATDVIAWQCTGNPN